VPHNPRRRFALFAAAAVTALAGAARSAEPGLLFRLSADKTLTAEVAGGDPVPNFADKVTLVPTGFKGGALSAADDVVLAWKAPGNIYAQRGTLSFFWRSRYPVGEAPFPIFRVGYADHTSWDMAWLRIDWNGDGFDAFHTAQAASARRLDAPGLHLGRDPRDRALRRRQAGRETGGDRRLGHRPRPVRPHQPGGLAPPGAEPLQLPARR
jgi:hypothetical protein